MKYYISSPYSGPQALKQVMQEVKPKNLLVSIADTSSMRRLTEMIADVQPETIMIDSGAFTAWNSGKPMTMERLISEYKQVQELIPKGIEVFFISLDVIPGAKGRKPTKQEADEATKQSWDNYMVLKDKFPNVLPVFHEDDDWDYLYKMMKVTDYIAISPANDSSVKRRMMWLDKVYSILKANYKTHGLAATSEKLLARYPFYSVDSINWKTIMMFGNGKSYKDKRIGGALARDKRTTGTAVKNELLHTLQLEKTYTKLWQARGVKW